MRELAIIHPNHGQDMMFIVRSAAQVHKLKPPKPAKGNQKNLKTKKGNGS
jgi:hypothetical protein